MCTYVACEESVLRLRNDGTRTVVAGNLPTRFRRQIVLAESENTLYATSSSSSDPASAVYGIISISTETGAMRTLLLNARPKLGENESRSGVESCERRAVLR